MTFSRLPHLYRIAPATGPLPRAGGRIFQKRRHNPTAAAIDIPSPAIRLQPFWTHKTSIH
jgi:hypothetical protein